MSAKVGESTDEVPFWMRALTLVVLAVATSIAFAGVARAGWILFDDTVYVFANTHIARGITWDGLRWVMTHAHGGNFHPLTSFSHMLDSQFFGLDPRGPHLVSLGLHVVDALLLCIVLFRYTRAWWRSALVAAFFALHPLRVESVAWISERKDVLSTLFFLLALEAYRRWVEKRTRGRYALLCLWFLLGLCAKPMLVTLPVVLLLLDIWPLGRAPKSIAGWGPIVREKIPLFALSFVASLATFLVQRASGAVMSTETQALPDRVLNAFSAYARYVCLSIYPHDLAVYYPLAAGRDLVLPLASACAIALVTWLAWRSRERRAWFFVGWSWFLVTLVPVIGIVQVGGQALADRYTYITTIGLSIVVVWGACELVGRLTLGAPGASSNVVTRENPANRASFARAVAIGFALVALVGLGVATNRQVALWKDTRTLFTHALAVTRGNFIAHQVLGNDLLLAGEIDPAIVHLEEALRLMPDFADAHNNLGSALGTKQRFDEAVAHFRTALRLKETAEVHHNLGFALAEQGHPEEAMREYEAALLLDPDDVRSNSKLGMALAERGELDRAAVHLQRAVDLSPADIETRRWLAITRTMQGRVEEGIQAYREILARDPKDLDAMNNIAWVRATHSDAKHRDGAEAVRLAEEARTTATEENAVLFSTLAAAYGESGRFDDAVRTCEHAIELARKADKKSDAERFEAQLACYRSGRAFHFAP